MTDPNHIAEARKKVSRPQIREVFLRNGAVIPADRDDLPDYVYEAAFELLEMAAPAVQGEPVAWSGWGCQYPGKMPRLYGERRIAELNCDWENGDQLLNFTAAPQPAEHHPECGCCGQTDRCDDDCDAAPQSAAHQPCPEGVREGAPYDDPAFESLCREYGIWGTAAAAQCAVFWGAGKRVADQKPAPDVSALVEALDDIANLPIDPCSTENDYRLSAAKAIANAALAAYREGGEK